MVASTLIAVVLLGAAARTAAGCGNAMDCSLNGDCTKNGCVCDAPWAGASCGRLLRFPAKPGGAYGFGKRFETTSWGGNSLKGDDGLWHLYVTEYVPHPRIADRDCAAFFLCALELCAYVLARNEDPWRWRQMWLRWVVEMGGCYGPLAGRPLFIFSLSLPPPPPFLFSLSLLSPA